MIMGACKPPPTPLPQAVEPAGDVLALLPAEAIDDAALREACAWVDKLVAEEGLDLVERLLRRLFADGVPVKWRGEGCFFGRRARAAGEKGRARSLAVSSLPPLQPRNVTPHNPNNIPQIRPVERRLERHAPRDPQLRAHVRLHARRRRRRQREQGDARVPPFEDRQPFIVRPEVVPPLRHAVRFVHHEPIEHPSSVTPVKGAHEGVGSRDFFGRDKKQARAVARGAAERGESVALVLPTSVGRQVSARDACGLEVKDLVLDEGDEGGDDDGDACGAH